MPTRTSRNGAAARAVLSRSGNDYLESGSGTHSQPASNNHDAPAAVTGSPGRQTGPSHNLSTKNNRAIRPHPRNHGENGQYINSLE